jgi:2-haloacid dehalogenase
MKGIKAIAFDLYGTLFDVHSVIEKCSEKFPERGPEISFMWRQKQLEYTWLRSLMGRYATFEAVTREALEFTCKSLQLHLDEQICDELCDAYLRLQPYPDVADTLSALRQRGLKLAILSNGSTRTIDAVTANSGLDGAFDHLLSVDAVRVFKPDQQVYRLAESAFGVGRESIMFVSSNAWDATGARYFGFPTCWINRSGKPFEEMGQRPDREAHDLSALIEMMQDR